jgi:hypothetical protein
VTRSSAISKSPPSAAPLARWLAHRLDEPAARWLAAARQEIAAGAEDARFAALLSQASRHAPRGALAPDAEERADAAAALAGWEPERWSVLEAARVLLVLSRPDLAEEAAARALEEAFRYADVGELVALYRALAHLPAPERFVRRAAEGCRTNMRAVFEAVATDNPFPARCFDDLAWRQMLIKCVFVDAPLWRVFGLDERLDPELARMALDLVDERRAAGRFVQPELWLCLGAHGGARGLASLERELASDFAPGRRAAALALARAGERGRLEAALARERDPAVRRTMEAALAGHCDRRAFRGLAPREIVPG